MAALLAISLRCSGVNREALALPPLLPSSTAAADFFGSMSSSISPFRLFTTLTAVPITSRGRFSPRGPVGILGLLHGVWLAAFSIGVLSGKHIAR